MRAQRRLPVAIVQDGAPELWHLTSAACAQHPLRPAVELIDRFHVDERVAAVAELVEYGPPAPTRVQSRWRAALDRSDAGIDLHRHRMRYASVARRGFPIGSGVTAGACKSVITVRCKRSGQRWLESGPAASPSRPPLERSPAALLRPRRRLVQARRSVDLTAPSTLQTPIEGLD